MPFLIFKSRKKVAYLKIILETEIREVPVPHLQRNTVSLILNTRLSRLRLKSDSLEELIKFCVHPVVPVPLPCTLLLLSQSNRIGWVLCAYLRGWFKRLYSEETKGPYDSCKNPVGFIPIKPTCYIHLMT
jgi:hypothetical protein